MDDDVDLGHQRVDSFAVQDVALLVGGFRPAVGRRVERAPRHPDDAVHRRITLERFHCRDPDLTGRPADGDCEPRHLIRVPLPGAQNSETAIYGSTMARTFARLCCNTRTTWRAAMRPAIRRCNTPGAWEERRKVTRMPAGPASRCRKRPRRCHPEDADPGKIAHFVEFDALDDAAHRRG